ncbi:MAG: hypothetical protein RIS47_1937 [Bacteroidota bacterium]|jgi:hypothetical protein
MPGVVLCKGYGGCIIRKFVVLNCSKLLGEKVSWPQAKVKFLPLIPTALQIGLPLQLARIAASSPQHARSSRWCCG